MTRISHEIQVRAPRERVWAALADLGAIQDFHPGVSKSYYTSERREGVGASRHCDLKPFGSVEERAIDWRDGELIKLEIYESAKLPPFESAVGELRVSGADGETIAALTLEYTLKGGPFGRALDRLMVRPRFERMVPAILAGLKRHVERTGQKNAA